MIRMAKTTDAEEIARLSAQLGYSTAMEQIKSRIDRFMCDKNAALALASQHGHAEIVRLLLDGGCDPNRYNPVGFHAHSTPLHQAAARGHDQVVRLLVERGARPDIKDTTSGGGTPASWARHDGHKDIEEYLQVQGALGQRRFQPD